MLMLAGTAGILFIVWQFVMAGMREFFETPSLGPEVFAITRVEITADENAFYLEPPTEKPIFLSKNEIVKKREALVWDKRDFLLADLGEMSISWYEKGALRRSFAIAAKPDAGSFFAPPGGFYTIQGKAAEHFSKINSVRVPWAVYLYGNYMIHGIAAASKTVGLVSGSAGARASGIEVSREDSQAIFEFAKKGMPVLVEGGTAPGDVAFAYFRKTVLPHRVPEVSAASALAADLETGEVIFEKNTNDAFPIASITKLVTALVAEERIKPSTLLVVGDEALRTYGNAAGLVKGEIFRADDLRYGMILPSSNNAAKMFELAVPDFIAHMNEEAQKIGMAHTFFKDSSGLSHDNISSAKDLFTLLRHLDASHPDILALSQEQSHSAVSQNKLKTHVWSNVNWPRGDARFLGGKAGFTDDSLQTMAGIYRVRTTEYGGRKIGIVVLGSRDRIRDIRALVKYLEENYIYGFAVSTGDRTLHPVVSGAAIYEAVENLR